MNSPPSNRNLVIIHLRLPVLEIRIDVLQPALKPLRESLRWCNVFLRLFSRPQLRRRNGPGMMSISESEWKKHHEKI